MTGFALERASGLAARQRGDRAVALGHFRRSVELDPQAVWAWHDIATELCALGRLDEAADTFRKALTIEPAFTHGWRGLGLIARQRGDRLTALAHFRKAVDLDPKHIWAWHDIAIELRELGRLNEAADIFRDVVAQDPLFSHGWRGLGLLASQQGDRAKALEHFQKAAELEPGNTWLQHDIATELRELGRLDEAAGIFRVVVAQDPLFSHGWRGLGLIASQQGDRAKALEHFQKAAQLEPGNTWFRHDIATELRALGQLDEAADIFHEVVAQDPLFSHGWRGLGLIARECGERTAALEHFRQSAKLAPENIWAWCDIATELRDLGRAQEAVELLRSLLEIHADSAEALVFFANAARQFSDLGQTVELLRKALELQPHNLQAQLALAGEYLRTWRLNEADALYDAALLQRAGDPSALIGKAQVARCRGQVELSMKMLQQACDVQFPSDSAALELSRELLNAGQLDKAKEILTMAISRHPRQPVFHLHLGYWAREIGDHPAAQSAFAAAAQLTSGQPQAKIDMAEQEVREGRLDKALALLSAVVQQHPHSGNAMNALADIAQQLDDMHVAVALRRKAVAIDASNMWWQLQLARGLEKLGQSRDADALLASYEQSWDTSPEIVITKAALLHNRGEFRAAREVLANGAARFPTHFELWFQRVAALITGGDFGGAKCAIDAPPGSTEREKVRTNLLLGQMAAARWDVESAYSYFVRALQFNPSDGWAHDCASRMALLRVDLEAAQSHQEQAARNNPAHRLAHDGGWKWSQTHVGQLLDEYRLDKTALALLRDSVAADDRIRSLAKLVEMLPDYTPAALHLMVALRQRGDLERPTTRSNCASLIPRRIIQFWDQDIPADVEALCNGWRDMHPEFAYRRFSSLEAQRYLTENRLLGVLGAFNRAQEPAMKADIFRLACLYHQGGFYMDADDRCLAPVSSLDPGDRDLILYQEDFGTVGNNFIGVSPGHPVIRSALNSAVEGINRGDTDTVWLLTGPGLLTRSLARYLAEQMPERLARTLIMERHELFEACAIHCVTSYKHTSKHWSRTSFRQPRARMAMLLDSVLGTASRPAA